MKGSVLTSILLHALLAAWLLVSFGSPEPFEVQMSEAMPVELVPIEDLAQLQQGDKEAPKKERSATEVTQKEDPVPDAQNTGDNNFDLASHEVGGKRGGKVAALLGGMILDADVTTIEITELAQSLLEVFNRIRRSGRWKKV